MTYLTQVESKAIAEEAVKTFGHCTYRMEGFLSGAAALARIRAEGASERCEHDVHGTDCVQCFPSVGPNFSGVLTEVLEISERAQERMVNAAVKAERERCAKTAENWRRHWCTNEGEMYAKRAHQIDANMYRDLERMILNPKPESEAE